MTTFAFAVVFVVTSWSSPGLVGAQESESEAETEANPDTGTEAGTDTLNEAGTEAGGQADTEAGGEADTEAGGQAGTVIEAETGTEAGAEAGADAEPATVTLPAEVPSHPPAPESHAEEDPELPRGTFVAGRFHLRPMLEVRERFEARIDPYSAGGTGEDAYFVGSRARVGLDASFEFLRLLVQVADARSFGQFPAGTDDGATTGLHQGFFDVAFGQSWLRIGRQEILLGRQRLIGALNWSTSGRSFDAMRLHLGLGDVSLDIAGAVTRWVRSISYTIDAGDPPGPEERSVRSEGDYLAMIHLTWDALEAIGLDAYVLYRHDGPSEPAAGADPLPFVERSRDIASPGLRLFGNPAPGLSYDVEGSFQLGQAGSERHLALAAAAELAYVVQVPMHPGFALGVSYASGGTPGDSLNEFDNFYPTNHPHYGFADLFGWRNVIHGFFRISAAPAAVPITFSVNNHVFALASPGDRWSSAGGATLGVDPSNRDRFLGYELDIEMGYAPRSWLKLSLGYSLFVPAGAAENLGHDAPTHWTYVMIGSVLP